MSFDWYFSLRATLLAEDTIETDMVDMFIVGGELVYVANVGSHRCAGNGNRVDQEMGGSNGPICLTPPKIREVPY